MFIVMSIVVDFIATLLDLSQVYIIYGYMSQSVKALSVTFCADRAIVVVTRSMPIHMN